MSTLFSPLYLEQGLANYFVKSQILNIFGFMDQMFSVTTIQLCHCNVKAAIYNMNGVAVF